MKAAAAVGHVAKAPSKTSEVGASLVIAGLRVHPLRARLSQPSEDVIADLMQSIAAQGLRRKIVVDQRRRILDGVARALAWKRLGRPGAPEVEEWGGDDPASYILSTWTLAPRTPARRAFAGALLMPELQREAKERQRRTADPQKSAALEDARDAAERAVGVNHRYIDLAVRALASKNGTRIERCVDDDLLNIPQVERLMEKTDKKQKVILDKIQSGVDARDLLRPKKDKKTGADSDRWLTPDFITDAVRIAFGGEIVFDPATELCEDLPNKNPVGALKFCYLEGPDSGLDVPWPDKTWCNPPFSELTEWLVKARTEFENRDENGKRIYLLVPTNLDTPAMHDLLALASDALLIRGRVAFTPVEADDHGSGRGSHMIVALGTTVQNLLDSGLYGMIMSVSRPPRPGSDNFRNLTVEEHESLDRSSWPTVEERALAQRWAAQANDEYERRAAGAKGVKKKTPKRHRESKS